MDTNKNEFEKKAGQREKTPPMLLNEVSRLIMACANKAHGESAPRIQHSCRIILARLSRQDGLTQAELVNVSKMTPPSISATLKNMESDGLIIRKKDEKDQRITRVYLTELGKETEEKNYRVITEVDKLAMSGISKAEQDEFVKTLAKMRENLIKELSLKDETE